MPYISWEWETQKHEMDDVIEKLQRDAEGTMKNVKKMAKGLLKLGHDDDSTKDPPQEESDPDVLLLKNYLYVKSPMSPIHIRRTLDQFYYYMSEDTKERDADQVISRHFRRKYPEKPVPIMMVDQLWLWILDESMDEDNNQQLFSPRANYFKTETIITCFPKGWGNAKYMKDNASILDTIDILESVLRRLRKKFRNPVLSVTELADLIVTRCLGLHFDEELWETERHRHLEIFDYSIHYIVRLNTR